MAAMARWWVSAIRSVRTWLTRTPPGTDGSAPAPGLRAPDVRPAAAPTPTPDLPAAPRPYARTAARALAPAGGGAGDLAVLGTVLDARGVHQPGASLTLLAANGEQVARATTGEDGRYTLPVPGSGAYIVVATSPSLGATSHSLLVADADVELDLRVELPGDI